jgi:hypothetical protein
LSKHMRAIIQSICLKFNTCNYKSMADTKYDVTHTSSHTQKYQKKIRTS